MTVTTAYDTITTIDGHYYHPGRAAAFLLQEGEEAAFVDTVTRFSVPYLMKTLEDKGLSPEQVRYIIITHIHLDHSGGTAELVKQCPKAQVICHPRAARHIVDPTRLVAGATDVYGEDAFRELYGEVEPVDADRVQSIDEGETLPLGARTLSFMDAPGHAGHHLTLQDSLTNALLAGDAFGLCYEQLQHGAKPYLSYVCAPPQFDPAAARKTVRRIMDSGADRVYVTHFGSCDAVQQGGELLLQALDLFDALVDEAASTDLEGDALLQMCAEKALAITNEQLRMCGLDTGDDEVMRWALSEHTVTSQGLQVLAERRRKTSGD